MNKLLLVGLILLCGCAKEEGAVNRLFRSQGVKNPDQCHEWAFSKEYNPFESYKRWNELHGDIFVINGSDIVKESYERIAKACVAKGF